MPRIYRVETVRQKGMYHNPNNGFLTVAVDDRMRHPPPMCDSLLCRNLDIAGYSWLPPCHYFGFVSVDQLKRWIYMDEWREALNNMGYMLSVYETPEVIAGDTQAIFELNHPETKLVERLDLRAI